MGNSRKRIQINSIVVKQTTESMYQLVYMLPFTDSWHRELLSNHLAWQEFRNRLDTDMWQVLGGKTKVRA